MSRSPAGSRPARRPRPQIWLADLVKVIERLEIRDDRTLACALEALDIGFLPGSGRTAVDDRPGVGDSDAVEERPEDEFESDLLAGEVELLDVEVPELDPVATEAWDAGPDWGWGDAETLDAVEARHEAPDLRHRPLFRPVATPPLLADSLTTAGPGGPIDVERLVRLLVRARPIREIPTLPRPSLYRGVRVLVDGGPAMEPFRRDQRELLSELRKLISAALVEAHYYELSPLRKCGPGSLRTWKEFSPPHPGTPVLVLGDLGIGNGAPSVQAEWLELADLLRRRGSRLLAFVPYPRRRWPRELANAFDLVVWDRRTSISDIGFRIRRC